MNTARCLFVLTHLNWKGLYWIPQYSLLIKLCCTYALLWHLQLTSCSLWNWEKDFINVKGTLLPTMPAPFVIIDEGQIVKQKKKYAKLTKFMNYCSGLLSQDNYFLNHLWLFQSLSFAHYGWSKFQMRKFNKNFHDENKEFIKNISYF